MSAAVATSTGTAGCSGPIAIASAVGSIVAGSALAVIGAGCGLVTGAGGTIGLTRRAFALGFGVAAAVTARGGGGSSVIVACNGGASGADVKSTGHSEKATWTASDANNAITKPGRTRKRGKPANVCAGAFIWIWTSKDGSRSAIVTQHQIAAAIRRSRLPPGVPP